MEEEKYIDLNEMNEEEQTLYYIDSLINTYEECIKEDKYKEDINEFKNLLSVLKDIKSIYLRTKSLASVEEITMNNFLEKNDELFDKYLIDELDFNGGSLNGLYKKNVKKEYVENLRKINREKRKERE